VLSSVSDTGDAQRQILRLSSRFVALGIRFCLCEADLWLWEADSAPVKQSRDCGRQILPLGSKFVALGGRFCHSAKVILIHKDKDNAILDHFTPIALLNTIYQLIHVIITSQLRLL